MFTIDDVGKVPQPDGSFKELSVAEKQAIVDEWNANLTKVEIPKTVTMRQARLALHQAGLLPNIEAALNSLPSPQKEAAQIEWEYSQEVVRQKELVQMLAPALGLNDQQLDDLFVLASTL